MPHLLQQFLANKGIVIAKRLESLDEIAFDYDVIINCTGLGSKQLIGDQLVHPIRGHIFRVKLNI
jgi:shikimate 5-dehydrogenase